MYLLLGTHTFGCAREQVGNKSDKVTEREVFAQEGMRSLSTRRNEKFPPKNEAYLHKKGSALAKELGCDMAEAYYIKMLAPEPLENIFSHIEDQRTLYNLTRVGSRASAKQCINCETKEAST